MGDSRTRQRLSRVIGRCVVATGPMVLILLAVSGCQVPYLVSQLAGETRLLAGARPVSEVREDPGTHPELAARLDEAEDVVAFAAAQGFRVGDAYRTYVDPPDGVPVWIVAACPPDRLEPVAWAFPIVGTFPYKGFFRRSIAEAEVRRLEREGLEVVLRPAAAFSTLGWFSDPLLPSLLEGDSGLRAGGILHELAHRTVFVPGDARLNESIATSIEDRGVDVWLERRGDIEGLEEHGRRVRDRARLRREVATTLVELRIEFEASDRDDRLAARRRVFAGFRERLESAHFETERYRSTQTVDWTLPALLLRDVYGGDGPILDAVWRASERRLPVYLELLRQAAGSGDPRAELDRIARWGPNSDSGGNAPLQPSVSGDEPEAYGGEE